jgi:hypothetical protein
MRVTLQVRLELSQSTKNPTLDIKNLRAGFPLYDRWKALQELAEKGVTLAEIPGRTRSGKNLNFLTKLPQFAAMFLPLLHATSHPHEETADRST